MSQTLFWYDIETFGTNPGVDKIAQFAGIRTNDKFEPIGEPIVLYCKISQDYFPDPLACLITGITPRITLSKGISEYEFIKKINHEFSQPGTCVVGYNTLRFDDEFIRNALYRNFMDPYAREYQNGNSRWDLIDLARAAHDLRPDGINWPLSEISEKEKGPNEGQETDENNSDKVKTPTFRLEKLTQANGLSHDNAHDALSDVQATIDFAKLIYEKQPKLFQFYFKIRRKDELKKIINLQTREPVVHTSGMFTTEKGCTTLVSPITVDSQNRNLIITYDLRYDPGELLSLDVEEIKLRVFTPQDQLGEGVQRIQLKGIHINKCPFVAPLNTLDDESARRLGIDKELCIKHYEMLKNDFSLSQKVMQVFAPKEHGDLNQDPDLQIYSGGFFNDADRERFEIIHNTPPEELLKTPINFDDPRVPEMIWRFIGRNFTHLFDEENRKKWKNFCAGRLLYPPDTRITDFNFIKRKLEEKLLSKDIEAEDKKIVKELLEYAALIENDILS